MPATDHELMYEGHDSLSITEENAERRLELLDLRLTAMYGSRGAVTGMTRCLNKHPLALAVTLERVRIAYTEFTYRRHAEPLDDIVPA